MSAYETASGRRLWDLPGGGRIAPNVDAVWHGAVYGDTEDNGPVVLDARTGQDREAEPGAKVLDVGPYGAAVSGEDDDRLYFYPASA